MWCPPGPLRGPERAAGWALQPARHSQAARRPDRRPGALIGQASPNEGRGSRTAGVARGVWAKQALEGARVRAEGMQTQDLTTRHGRWDRRSLQLLPSGARAAKTWPLPPPPAHAGARGPRFRRFAPATAGSARPRLAASSPAAAPCPASLPVSQAHQKLKPPAAQGPPARSEAQTSAACGTPEPGSTRQLAATHVRAAQLTDAAKYIQQLATHVQPWQALQQATTMSVTGTVLVGVRACRHTGTQAPWPAAV